ncbi:MAG: hypothetical protein KC502_06695 [Myxococcales bacterium]|nr:hypothetical protein [Myxococcales bacterium]
MGFRHLAAAAALACTVIALPQAHAGLGDSLPRGTFLIDAAYIYATTSRQFDRNGKSVPLLAPTERYEAGAGLQGIIRATPSVQQKIFALRVLYGITDRLTIAFANPLSLETVIQANLAWEPGDYQASLGRPYSEQDFWEWAGSMGQRKPVNRAVSNKNAWGDTVVALRYRLPSTEWMLANNISLGMTLQGALPTGRDKNPEALLEIGNTAWWLHNYGDAEAHLSIDWRPWWTGDVARLTLSAEGYYAWLRTRTYDAATGSRHPLLLTQAPYVGETYKINGGDWQVGRVQIEWAPIIGPTLGTWMTQGSVEKARKFPPLLSLLVQYSFVNLQPSVWESNYDIWSVKQAEFWGAGYKHIFAAQATLSLLRVGAPMMLYVRGRSLDILPGKNMRPANAVTVGMRLLLKFW